MAWDDSCTDLRDILAEIYFEAADAKRLARDAQLNLTKIDFSGKSINFWTEIIRVAEQDGQLLKLIERVRNENARNQKLSALQLRFTNSNIDHAETSPTESPDMTSSPKLPPTKRLTFTQRSELVNSLLEIPAMADPNERSNIISELPLEIKGSISYSKAGRAHVFSIVRTCLGYPRGMETLRDVVQEFSDDKYAFDQFEKTLNRLFLGG